MSCYENIYNDCTDKGATGPPGPAGPAGPAGPPGPPSTQTWDQTLTLGNNSGANNPIIDNPQSIIYSSGITMGANGFVPPAAPDSVSIIQGDSNVVTATRSITQGASNTANGDLTITLGNNCTNRSTGGLCMGHFTVNTPTNINRNASAVGYGCKSLGDESCSFGIVSEANALHSYAAGYEAKANGPSSTSLGRLVTADGNSSIVAGFSSRSKADRSAVYGPNATVETGAVGSIALGDSALVNTGHSGSAALLGTTTSSNQIMLGTSQVVEIPGLLNYCQAVGFDDVNGNSALYIQPGAAGQTGYIRVQADSLTPIISSFSSVGPNQSMLITSFGDAPVNINTGTNTNQVVATKSYFRSTNQAGASVGIRLGVDPVQLINATTTANLAFVFTYYNDFPVGDISYIGANQFNLQISTMYTASFYVSFNDVIAHTNTTDILISLILTDASGSSTISMQTVYYPVTKSAGIVSLAATFQTTNAANPVLICRFVNNANRQVRILEWKGFVTRAN